MTSEYEKALESASTEKIYMHYFDIEQLEPDLPGMKGIFPNNVVKDIDTSFRDFEIVPTIYITNQVMKVHGLELKDLADKIVLLIEQISDRYLKKKHITIQVDCDWTKSTRNTYFKLLKYLKKSFQVDVTIRLHQIKYKERTGIPPVKHGTLMLYNVGDLKDKHQNSILKADIVKQYISESTEYPLPLHLGLPLFNQTVAFNNKEDIKIIKDADPETLTSDRHFKKVDDHLYKVIHDTLYKGIYLDKGFFLKTEQSLHNEIVSSYKVIESSALNINEIIFYHLDENSLRNINFKALIEAL